MLNIDLDALQREIDNCAHGSKTQVVRRYANSLGVSTRTVWRELHKHRGTEKRIERAKKIEDDLIDMVAAIKVRTANLSYGKQQRRELSTARCIKRLQEQGVPGAEQLTVSTVNRRLHDSGFWDPQPRQLVECTYANEEHQIDFSRSKYFQIWKYDETREDFLLKVSGKELFYKQDDRKMRTWICQIKDSYSRVRVARAHAATSEDGFIGLDTMNWLLNRNEDEHPLCFLPDNMKSDQGSFFKRREVKAALEAFEVNFDKSKHGNSESQGKVESGFRSLWWEFELDLADRLGEGSTLYLSEYNSLIHEWLAAEDAQKQHPRQNDTREAVYRKSLLKVPPRSVDVDILRVACRVEPRTVPPTLEIKYDNKIYHAPSYCSGKKIRVYQNMNGDLMGELISEYRKPFEMKPYRFAKRGDFSHRPRQTYRQQIEQDVGTQKRREDNRLFMKPKPQPVQPQSPFTPDPDSEQFESTYAAKVYIGKRLQSHGLTYADLADVFDPLIQEDLSKSSVDAVLEEVKRMRIAL